MSKFAAPLGGPGGWPAGWTHTATGGEILIVQYPRPSSGERPIYAGRFNMETRKALDEERVDL